ncbi:hypothetical protein LHJ74_02780 [Streptomyces sp. N2-109]|uniref:DUF732 domain-containing protein n=1 Tax=Streptomyces gossypii TaxID=2883101 RepID=A0ABT2JLW4_9ACTN|nr:hypothetical protein [Streptomyces gossypii]MCT2588868.1 hypothetical protein [Streptomyces gossypii]
MRQMLSTRRQGVALVLLAPGMALLLAGCGSEGADKAGPDQPSTGGTSESQATRSPGPEATPDKSPSASPRPTDDKLPAEPTAESSSQVDEAFGAARAAALQSGLRYIDAALGTAKDISKADAQCADLQRTAATPDQLAAERFSTGNHTVTEADGKRINTLLRNTYCG